MEGWPCLLLVSNSLTLTLFGGWRRLGGLRCFALPQEPVVAKLPENIQEENSGDAQHDQALEQTIHSGDGAGDDDPGNPREGDETEQDGNQEHHGKQSPSSGSRRFMTTRSRF